MQKQQDRPLFNQLYDDGIGYKIECILGLEGELTRRKIDTDIIKEALDREYKEFEKFLEKKVKVKEEVKTKRSNDLARKGRHLHLDDVIVCENSTDIEKEISKLSFFAGFGYIAGKAMLGLDINNEDRIRALYFSLVIPAAIYFREKIGRLFL